MRVSLGLFITASALVLTNCATSQNNPIYQQTTKYQSSVPTSTMVQRASYETQAPANIQYVNTNQSHSNLAQISLAQANLTQPNVECASNEANRKLIGGAAGGIVGAVVGRKIAGDNKTIGTLAGAAIGGAAGYGIADKSIDCDPIPVQPAHTVQSYQSSQQNVTLYPADTTSVVTPNTTPDVTYNDASYNYETTSIEENTNSFGEEGTPGYYAVNGFETTPDTLQHVTQEQGGFVVVQEQPEIQHAEAAPNTPIAVAPASLNTRHHIIVPGDTVYSLARTSCLSVSDLKTANGINDEFYIRVGDEIMIPLSKCVE